MPIHNVEYVYFISYTAKTKDGVDRLGHSEVGYRKITSLSDVKAIEEVIAETNGFEAAMITNFILMKVRKAGKKNEKI